MRRIISLLTIVLIIGFISISFAGFDDYGYYRVNEKARVLQLEADGVNIFWQWSKGVDYTGAALIYQIGQEFLTLQLFYLIMIKLAMTLIFDL